MFCRMFSFKANRAVLVELFLLNSNCASERMLRLPIDVMFTHGPAGQKFGMHRRPGMQQIQEVYLTDPFPVIEKSLGMVVAIMTNK